MHDPCGPSASPHHKDLGNAGGRPGGCSERQPRQCKRHRSRARCCDPQPSAGRALRPPALPHGTDWTRSGTDTRTVVLRIHLGHSLSLNVCLGLGGAARCTTTAWGRVVLAWMAARLAPTMPASSATTIAPEITVAVRLFISAGSFGSTASNRTAGPIGRGQRRSERSPNIGPLQDRHTRATSGPRAQSARHRCDAIRSQNPGEKQRTGRLEPRLVSLPTPRPDGHRCEARAYAGRLGQESGRQWAASVRTSPLDEVHGFSSGPPAVGHAARDASRW
jgi:hypothetical protein